MRLDLELVKQYMRVDYDDDDEIIQLIIETVLDELADLIPDFKRDEPTNRQKMLILTSVKELYDNREKRTDKPELLRAAVSSMLLKEMYK
jgi:uncharacterized phage protein (predicted DNA packaging)